MLKDINCLKKQSEPNIDELLVERRKLEKLYEELPERINSIQWEIDRLVRPKYNGLTPRQQEILGYVRISLTNKEIGSKLHLAERTIKFHVSRLLKKSGKTHRKEL